MGKLENRIAEFRHLRGSAAAQLRKRHLQVAPQSRDDALTVETEGEQGVAFLRVGRRTRQCYECCDRKGQYKSHLSRLRAFRPFCP